jgi:hypothetical protein
MKSAQSRFKLAKFRVIIAGGRDFSDYDLLEKTMDNLLANKSEIVIVCGLARGADSLGEQYAKTKGYEINYYPAEWDKYGNQAGFIRNNQMAENADALVAFWNGESKGTKHMISAAHKHKLQVRVKRY